MEVEHFSHQHNRSLHQVEPGSEVHCNGCNTPGSGSVYGCWHCRFFLHEECFRARRSITHPFHPFHPLTLMPYPTHPSGSFICNACGSTGSGFCFTCSHCDYDIHVHCASLADPIAAIDHEQIQNLRIQSDPASQAVPLAKSTTPEADVAQRETLPNPLPEPAIRHESHPEHILTYHSSSPYDSGSYICNACGSEANEKLYHCVPCKDEYDLHVDCANLTRSVTRKDHDHPLLLLYKVPSEGFICDVCCADVPQGRWIYYCSESDYGTHLECAEAEVDFLRQHMNKRLRSQKQFMEMQLKIEMQRMTFSAINRIIRG